jgi:predicted DNA-binding protein (MmcQ/YjbR family)
VKATERSALERVEASLRKAGLAYPETREDHPWGERAIKVRGKMFLLMSFGDDGFHVTVKLPQSNQQALSLPFASPTGYGLGRSGWVSSHFTAARQIPVDLIHEWIDESYRAVAPKKLSAGLPPSAPGR